MTEAERVFNATNAERKRNARGAQNKKRQGGSVVRLPSDHMSKTEMQALTGQPELYQLGKPMSWEQYQELPEDLKLEYMKMLHERYKATPKMLSEMFGKSASVCTFERKRLKLNFETAKGKPPGDVLNRWQEFLATGKTGQKVGRNIKSTPDIEQLATLLSTLKGTEARVTIEITL